MIKKSLMKGPAAMTLCINHRHASIKERQYAFSLVEVIVAMAVFSIAALGLAKTVFQSRAMAEGSIYMTTAHGVAYGYAEQLMAMDFADVMTSYNDPDIPLEMRALSPSSKSSSVEIDDPLYFNVWTDKDIVVDIREEGTSEIAIEMPMRFRVKATYLDSGSDPRKAFELTLSYAYKSPSRRGDNDWVMDDIRFVKSAVPVY